MGYMTAYLKTYGQPTTILRTPPVATFASLAPARAQVVGITQALWRGLALREDGLQPGEVLTVTDVGDFLVLTARGDAASGETGIECLECNATVDWWRYVETVDEWGNIIREWQQLGTGIKAHGEAVTAALRRYDPGLLDGTRYLFWLPGNLDVQLLDRIVWGGQDLQVDAIDALSLPGVKKLQCSEDVRT